MKAINKATIAWIIFFLFFALFLADRLLSLHFFAFVYTDIDQLVMWNGAMDYAQGIFHEPYFYGQNYNYMLEAFVAVPMILLSVPVFKALPMATMLISILPFVSLGMFLKLRNQNQWAYLCFALPLFLPLDYNFLMSIPRGFVQAFLFIPFLFYPLFKPEKKANVTLFYIFTALCIIANASSILIVFPIFFYLLSFHYKSISFYLKSLLTLPILWIDWWAKMFYDTHPEHKVHELRYVKLASKSFFKTLNKIELFEFLNPFTTAGAYYYPILFLLLAMVAYRTKKYKAAIFVTAFLFILLVTFSIPKVQANYPAENAGIFFSVSRFYLSLPFLAIIAAYLVFKEKKVASYASYLLLAIGMFWFGLKNFKIKKRVKETVTSTSFPAATNLELIKRAKRINSISSNYKVDCIILKRSPNWNWNNVFDSYAYYPLLKQDKDYNPQLTVFQWNDDRRTWLYQDSEVYTNILLVGFELHPHLKAALDAQEIENGGILIKGNQLPYQKLRERLVNQKE